MDVCVRDQSCVLTACWAVAAFAVCCAAADGSGSVLTARKNTELPDIPPSASPPPTAAPPSPHRFSITALARALPFPPRVKSMSTEAASRGPSFPFAFAAAPVKPPPLALLTADGRITHHHHHHLASTRLSPLRGSRPGLGTGSPRSPAIPSSSASIMQNALA